MVAPTSDYYTCAVLLRTHCFFPSRWLRCRDYRCCTQDTDLRRVSRSGKGERLMLRAQGLNHTISSQQRPTQGETPALTAARSVMPVSYHDQAACTPALEANPLVCVLRPWAGEASPKTQEKQQRAALWTTISSPASTPLAPISCAVLRTCRARCYRISLDVGIM